MQTERTLKITETADRYRLRQGQAASKPALILRGIWLRDAGFRADARAIVRVERNKITITPGYEPNVEVSRGSS